MIQRIQSVYLLIVTIIGGVLPFMVSFYSVEGREVYAFHGEWQASVLLMVSAVWAFLTIFQYRDRKRQFVMNRLNILILLILLGVFVYRVLKSSGEGLLSEKGVGMLLPLFSIVFLFLANKAIKRDEELVKSADRLR